MNILCKWRSRYGKKKRRTQSELRRSTGWDDTLPALVILPTIFAIALLYETTKLSIAAFLSLLAWVGVMFAVFRGMRLVGWVKQPKAVLPSLARVLALWIPQVLVYVLLAFAMMKYDLL